MSRLAVRVAPRVLRGLLAVACVLGSACSTGDVVDALQGAAPLSLSDQGLSVAVSEITHIELDAGFPTDLVSTDDGGFAVLDGVRRTLSIHAADGRELDRIVGSPGWGSPTRVLRLGDGWLLADPGHSGLDPGALVRLGPTGEVLATLDAVPAPIALAIDGDTLTVAGRAGQLVRCDLEAQGCTPLRGEADDGDAAAFVDLVSLDDGRLMAVDPLSSSVHLLSADGTDGTDESFGRYGHRVGSMQQPKAAAAIHSVLVVVDSALGVAQVFEASGVPLGPLHGDEATLRWEHPVAVRSLGGDRLAILDGATRRVTLVSVSSEALTAARREATHTRLRQPLRDPDTDGAAGCLQCHDGFIREGRSHADPALFAHPQGKRPDRPLPDFVVVDDDGKVVCGSCHANHGDEPTARIPHGSQDHLEGQDRSRVCVECHEDTAHRGSASLTTGSAARGHLVGAPLEEALARRPKGSTEQARGDCLACHVAHGARSERLLRAADLGGTCAGCHEDHQGKGRNHPLGAAFAASTPRPGGSARLMLDGDGGIGCGTCHDVVDGGGKGLLRRAVDGGPVCFACHTARRPEASGPHGRLGAGGGPACLACHDPHGSSRAAHLPARTTGGAQGCISCHGPDGSAAKPSVAPGDLGHPVTGAGEGDRALTGCLTCHDAHAPTDAQPCADCHAEQGDATTRGGHGGASCVSCHPAHGEPLPVPASARQSNPASQECLACHAPDAAAPVLPVAIVDHPEDVFLPDGSRWVALAGLPLFAPGGEPVPAGKNGALSCRSCHRVHGPEPGDKGGMLLPRGMESCASCHGPDALPLFRWFHDPVRRARVLGGAPQ